MLPLSVHLRSIKICSLPFKASLSRRQISSDWLPLANRRFTARAVCLRCPWWRISLINGCQMSNGPFREQSKPELTHTHICSLLTTFFVKFVACFESLNKCLNAKRRRANTAFIKGKNLSKPTRSVWNSSCFLILINAFALSAKSPAVCDVLVMSLSVVEELCPTLLYWILLIQTHWRLFQHERLFKVN